MAQKAALREGWGQCPLKCGHEVLFKRSSGGLLKFRCDRCMAGAYADQNGPAERGWKATITKPENTASPAPAAPPGPNIAGFLDRL